MVVKIDLVKGFKSRNRKTSGKPIEIIQEKDFNGLDHGGNNGVGKIRLDSRYLLKVEPVQFSGRLNVVSKTI